VGPNKLLQQGAQVALSAEDILNTIAPQWRLLDSKKQRQTHLPLPDTPQEASVLECIDRGVHHRDALVEQLQLPISEALRLLTMMELKDLIRSQGELIYRK
jgi:predicted Rossmann fold nucleotide-binding protein DprA/Smf involved in DNA uptake